MIPVLIVLQLLVLIALAVLLLRRPPAADPRQQQLPEQFTRLEGYVRDGLTQMRQDLPVEAARSRMEAAETAGELRREVIANIAALGSTLKQGLDVLRSENISSAQGLREEMERKMHLLSQNFVELKQETAAAHAALKDSVNTRLNDLMMSNNGQQDKLRTAVEGRLDQINLTNAAKLEEMRATVDEKLHATLHTRLTESFGQVTDQLNKVHTGLGEMSKLSEGMDDLSRIFTNVKSRGGIGEVQLAMLLRQMLAPGQFIEKAAVRPNSAERVDFAVRFPTNTGERLMPIDAKFPREDWDRLQAAYQSNIPADIDRHGSAFERAIRVQAEKICAKYINPPTTTPYAIMFLPTEGLYAEVIQREALQAELQSKCHVTIAGPTTLSAILTSFQMGFHMLALQEKGDEVWKVLESAKTEFKKFEGLMDKVEGDVSKIQKTLGDVGVRTRAINRTLRDVGDSGPTGELDFGEAPPTPLRLVASAED